MNPKVLFEIAKVDGIPVVEVPPSHILLDLAAAPDRNARMTVLLALKQEIVDECKAITLNEAVYLGQLLTLPGDAPIWVYFSDRNKGQAIGIRTNKGQAIGIRTLSNICEAYLGSPRFHAPRHTLEVTMHKTQEGRKDHPRLPGGTFEL